MIQTLYHPASATDTILTVLSRLVKFHPRTGHKGLALADLLPGKKSCTHCMGDGWAIGLSGLMQKIYCPTGIQSSNDQARSESLYPRDVE
jgi:hypothetical protein